jgi:YVTN family beta-propeller protein
VHRSGRAALFVAVLALGAGASACGGSDDSSSQAADRDTTTTSTTAPPTTTTTAPPTDVYSYTHAGMLASSVRDIPARVYVPNGHSSTVTVIDPATMSIIGTFPVGRLPQHVVPSYDMQTLYVNNNEVPTSLSTIPTTCTSRPTASTRW